LLIEILSIIVDELNQTPAGNVTAKEIIEVLKEELDIDKAVSERITTTQNTRNGSYKCINGKKKGVRRLQFDIRLK
jgi:hypothetical protein